MRRRTIISETIDDVEIEFEFEPLEWLDMHKQRVGDKIVVAYIAQDFNPENPMKSMDGEGELFTKPARYGGGSITDDSGWHAYLGLTEDGEPDLELDAVVERAEEKLAALIYGDILLSPGLIRIIREIDKSADAGLQAVFKEWSDTWGWNTGLEWSEEDQEMLASLPNYEATAGKCWNELYAEGKIGTYLAIPVSYCSSNHGPGTASADIASTDNCDAVWVPGPNEIDNMSFPENATYAEKLMVAEKYAKSCLNPYIEWCNGEVYGCVVQVHEAETGSQLECESCWGFYGGEYAEESLLNEFFKPAVERCLKETEAV